MALPKEHHNAIRMFSLIASLAIFVVSLGLIGPVWSAAPGKFALETNHPWIQTPAINYHTGMDGISLWLVMLSTLLTPLCVLVSWKSIDKHIKQFYRIPVVARIRTHRRLLRARFLPVLRLLGSFAGPDVLSDRDLGP